MAESMRHFIDVDQFNQKDAPKDFLTCQKIFKKAKSKLLSGKTLVKFIF